MIRKSAVHDLGKGSDQMITDPVISKKKKFLNIKSNYEEMSTWSIVHY